MEKKLTNSGRFREPADKHSIYPQPPGSLRSSLMHKHTAHAVQQVTDYIDGVAKKDREKMHRMAGVALNGNFDIVVRHVDGHFLVEDPVPVNERTTDRSLRFGCAHVSKSAKSHTGPFALKVVDTKDAHYYADGGKDGEHRGEAVSGAHKADWRMRELEKERCASCWVSTNAPGVERSGWRTQDGKRSERGSAVFELVLRMRLGTL
jgi:hypothetical protein